MKLFSARRGFTLIELLVVIAIIGLLASIISVSLISARAKGRDAKRVSDIRSLQLSLEEYYSDNATYPTSLAPLAPTYIPSIPKDPKDNSTSYLFTSYDATSAGSSNCATHPVIKYHLGAAMESDDTTNAALKQDVDFDGDSGAVTYTKCSTGSGAVFNGNAAACVGTTAGLTDNCYDVTN